MNYSVEFLVKNGFVFICACCEKLFDGLQKGLERCSDLKCVGSGNGFSGYKGFLTEGFIVSHCYVCGSDAKYIVHIKESEKKFGICENHLKVYKKSSGETY